MTAFADLHKLEEDQRIELIGEATMRGGKSSADKPPLIAFVVDDDGKKADRYIEKLQKKFPGIRVIDQFKGPTPGAYTVRIAPPLR